MTRLLTLALVAPLILILAPGRALAGKPGTKQKAARPAPTAKKATTSNGNGSGGGGKAASSESSRGSSDDGDDSSGTTETTVAPAAGGGKVKSKTYTFGAMDVEGKLKTPQLLYFLNRVKLELDMSAPDKRSFMKELQQSADDKNL